MWMVLFGLILESNNNASILLLIDYEKGRRLLKINFDGDNYRFIYQKIDREEKITKRQMA